jgi:magnesium chelatase subunit I
MVFVESGFELVDDCSDAEYERILSSIVPLEVLIKNTNHNLKMKLFMKEFILWD